MPAKRPESVPYEEQLGFQEMPARVEERKGNDAWLVVPETEGIVRELLPGAFDYEEIEAGDRVVLYCEGGEGRLGEGYPGEGPSCWRVRKRE